MLYSVDDMIQLDLTVAFPFEKKCRDAEVYMFALVGFTYENDFFSLLLAVIFQLRYFTDYSSSLSHHRDESGARLF